MNGIIEDEITIGTPIGEILPPESKAAELFVPNGLDKIIARVRQEVEQFQPDVSTEKGRKAIASLARKVASSSARLEDYGKNLSADIKIKARDIDAERKRMREALGELRDQARKPLTDYEAAVAAREEAHEQALKDVVELSNVPFGADVAEIERRIATLDEFALRPWEEFSERFSVANDAVSMRLTHILAETRSQEAERVAFKKLEAERIAREAKEREAQQAKDAAERDERVAREATEKAGRESAEREAKAKRDTEAAEARATQAEAQREAAEQLAARQAKEAAERAQQAQEAAVATEQKRAADAKAAEAAAAKARENDKAHKAEVHSAAIAAIVSLGLSEAPLAKAIVTAIAKDQIPNVRMVY
jgi:hypothetical protein